MSKQLTIDARVARVLQIARKVVKYTSEHWSLTKRADGTAQIYASSMGPCRRVVPIAETTVRFGEWITTLADDAPVLAREVVRLTEENRGLRFPSFDRWRERAHRAEQDLADERARRLSAEKCARGLHSPVRNSADDRAWQAHCEMYPQDKEPS